jgi:GntR family transcriptional regulator
MTVIDRGSPLPLYYQVKEAIRADIDEHRLTPGETIPPELELATRFAVSRNTIRQAVLDLVREGLLFRRQGQGTFVAEEKVTRGFPGLTSFTEDMTSKGFHPGARLVSLEVAAPPAYIVKNLRLGPGELAVRIQRQMLASGQPIGFHDVYLPERIWAGLGLPAAALENTSLYALLEQGGIKLDEADETIEVLHASEHIGKWLEVPVDSPILAMKRLTYSDEGRPVEFAYNLYRADRYKYEIHHRRVHTRTV